MTEKSGFRPDLEGLRAVAVLLVLLYHARVPLVTGGYVGVDVFFVLSGFLITGLLIRELGGTGRVDFAAFYARRARRLLPASALTLIVTIVAAAFLLPPVRLPDVAADTVSAGLYVSNMRFAIQATDYLNSTLPPSPVLHFWSLGVEEQFYLFWPALLTLVAGAAFRAGRRDVGLRRVGFALAAVLVASLLFEVWLTGVAQPWAFFALPARAWELALGGLLALPVATTLVPRRLGPWMGWAGVALIVGSGFVLSDATTFPGVAVLLPTLGSALVIAAGLAPGARPAPSPAPASASAAAVPATAAPPAPRVAAAASASIRAHASRPRDRRMAVPATEAARRAPSAAATLPSPGPARLLATGPMRYLGRISYSLYLWHWPILVIPAAFAGVDELPLPVRLVLAAAAVGVAALSQRFVEDPIRHGRFVGLASRRSLALAGALSLVVALTSVSANALATARLAANGPDVGGSTTEVTLPSSVPVASGQPGASASPAASPAPTTSSAAGSSSAATAAPTLPAPSPGPVPADLVPSLLNAANDLPVIYADGCHLDFATVRLPPNCVFGATSSSTTVALFGDSHAAQWFPALQRLAGQRGWRLETLTKSGCTPASLTVWNATYNRPYTECDQWRTGVLAHLAAERPALVIVSTSRAYEFVVGGKPVTVASHMDVWAKGLTTTLAAVAASAAHVALIGDTPRSLADPVACLSQHLGSITACAVPFAQAVDAGQVALESKAAAAAGAAFVDPTAWVCRTDPCPPVYGRFLIYRDQGHLTRTYASGLASELAAALPKLGS